ncbi:MAG: hypothetical protein SWX82_02575 [Cyanobacteriota bacterium]|nr:hypothetical protein [Cyanobacteriota bacterium]
MTIKTATITKKADGYYISFSLEDKSVPNLIPTNNIKIDVGLKEFLTTNTGETVKEIGSNNWRGAQNRIARLHQLMARQREDFHLHYCS